MVQKSYILLGKYFNRSIYFNISKSVSSVIAFSALILLVGH